MRTIFILATATLALTGGAIAQTPTKPVPATRPAAMAKPAPTAKPAPMAKPAPTAKPAATGRMATTTTKSGKKITYDCSKKGNMTKTACKK